MSKRGTSLVVRLTSFALLGVLGISGLAACDPGPAAAGADPGRLRARGADAAQRLPARHRRGVQRDDQAGLDQPDHHHAALDRRQRPRPQRGGRPAPRQLHPHAVHGRHRRRRQARPLGSGGPERHLRRHRRRRRRGHRHREHAPADRREHQPRQQLRRGLGQQDRHRHGPHPGHRRQGHPRRRRRHQHQARLRRHHPGHERRSAPGPR